MKKRIVLTVFSIVCMLTSCKPMTYEFPEVSFDSTIPTVSVDGFRMQMSARMAKQVAEERGYKINSKYSQFTFDDIAEGVPGESIVGPNIYLERGLLESVMLQFDYGRIESIYYNNIFDSRQQAEELLELYLARYPQLTLEKETDEGYRSYSYEPNRFASIKALIRMIGEKNWRVDISVHDRNYSQSRRNQELYEKIEAIRRRY